ncbi:MAG: hypothetical protein CSA09_02505 [Candidatus Contendobacter odensis]|uniref:PPM-type phosphatase domain-containing protein n=1 Tax=Candidatus Contendibacter odensensis TaxID=1400860 RepID=A0A2G6PGQ4_9GAMM|nr:MAG: hypothetical protein CSA09_02505 [Candidatus Contendobacter odensis]
MSTCGNWQFVHASVAGVAHLNEGIECQDACAVRLLERPGSEPILLLVAADGAGSAQKARDGAILACATLLEAMTEQLDTVSNHGWYQINGRRLLGRIRNVLGQRATDTGLSINEFACTVLAAALFTDRALLLQIGDGAIVLGSKGRYRVQFWPHNGQYPNETWFATDSDAMKRLEVAVVFESVTEIALLTDGLQRLALDYEHRQGYAPFFRPLFQQLHACYQHDEDEAPKMLESALAGFLAGAAINQRTRDDKTLVLAARAAALKSTTAATNLR